MAPSLTDALARELHESLEKQPPWDDLSPTQQRGWWLFACRLIDWLMEQDPGLFPMTSYTPLKHPHEPPQDTMGP